MALVILTFLLYVFPIIFAQDTAKKNISSSSSSVQFIGNWRSDLNVGYYEAYSNESVASATLTFQGVGAQYLAYRKYDRGLSGIQIDGISFYTVDLYDNSGYAQSEQIIWQSPVLPYGKHSITLYQLGPDARLGVYPYLISETWIVIYPTDIPAYTATEVQTTGAARSTATRSSSDHSDSPNIAPIVGGVVGSVIALGLLGFLLYLWRKDKRLSKEAEIKKLERKKLRELEMTQHGEGRIYQDKDYSGSHDDEGSHHRGGSSDDQRRDQNYIQGFQPRFDHQERRIRNGTNDSRDYSSKSSSSSSKKVRGPKQFDSSSIGNHSRSLHPSDSSRIPFQQPPYEALSLTGQSPSPSDSYHHGERRNGSVGGSSNNSKSYPYINQGAGRFPVPEV